MPTDVNPTPVHIIPEPFVRLAVGFGATTGVAKVVVVVLGRNLMVVVGPDGAADDELIVDAEEDEETGFEALESKLELGGAFGFEVPGFGPGLGDAFGFVAVTLKLSDETPEPMHTVL